MTEQEHYPICDLCLDYVSGICTDEQRLAFERHLPECQHCRIEIDELRIVWEALPEDMDHLQPPADLKQQVMDAVLTAQTDGAAAMPAKPRFRGSKAFYAVTAAAVVFILLASIWNYELYRERMAAPLPPNQALTASSAQITQLIRLKPNSTGESRSSGVACIVDNGQSKQFVVYVFGAAATNGHEAYQVWLLKDGNRRSAGTFRVDDSGVGIMTMPIADDPLQFDTIGITLEPDDHGSSPRGAKMFGSG